MKYINKSVLESFLKNLYNLKPNDLSCETIKLIVVHLNNITPDNVSISMTLSKNKQVKKPEIMPDYDEKIIERMIRNGGI